MNWFSYLKFIFCGMLALMMVTNVSYAQDLSALGLPALTTATGVNGETTYSLSLQILLLMTALTVSRQGHNCPHGTHIRTSSHWWQAKGIRRPRARSNSDLQR